jgi:long-chain acyl-CoA synthetase
MSAADTQKIWLDNYPDGVPAEIAPSEHASLADLLVASCETFRSRPAYTCMGKSLSYGDVEDASRNLAAFLQSKGLAKGDRVAIMMPNMLAYPVALMAGLRGGYAVVNVNPLYTPRELEHQLKDSGAEAIIVLENFASTVQAVIANTAVKHVVVANLGDFLGFKGLIVKFVVRHLKKMVPAWSLPGHTSFADALAVGAAGNFTPVDNGPEDIAFLQYTGGTTGVSKGAILLNRNVLANIQQNDAWSTPVMNQPGMPDQLTYVCALPLYHIFSLTICALSGMQKGAHNLLITNPRDIPAFVKDLSSQPFHVFPGLNTLFVALMNNAEFRKLDFSQLLMTFAGGMAMQRAVAEEWQELTGVKISEGYGLSETAPTVTSNRLDTSEFSGNIGLPVPSTVVVIRDEDGRDVPLGEPGEICISGPQVMAGYWQRPDETAEAMTEDGFFRSGDIGVLNEDGTFMIVDRMKDMILVSGFNVYPTEIEDVLATHPGILESAVVGVPDEKSGETVKIFLVKKDPALTEADVKAFCQKNFTGYKRPKHIEFRDDLPKSNVGKILRRELRET